MTPKFIVFEGIDGCGKGTQVELFCNRLRQNNIDVARTAEPTFSCVGGMIRDCLSGKTSVSPEELAALFLADRIHHNASPFDGIEKLLSDGKTVVCDRYYYSSIAYQGLECPINWVADMNLSCRGIRKPDLCIFLDLSPEESLDRMKNSGKALDSMESDLEKSAAIRKRFFDCFDIVRQTDNVVVVDASGTAREVSERIWERVGSMFNPL
ncbi:MAG: dTMP kinase [Clostridia bacterium]|nr:dTMP kinase [Clostridia bacterium]